MEFETATNIEKHRIEEHVFKMETQGYDVFEDFIDDEMCNKLKIHLESVLDNYVPFNQSERSFLDRYQMHDLLTKDLVFSKTLEDPRLQQIIASVLGENWIMYAYTSSSLPPGGGNYGSRIHVDSPRWIKGYPTNIGVIWALDDFTLENGATFVLPGSHNTSLTPSEELFNNCSVRLTCKKGSIVFFNARLWHKAGENITNKFRHALTMNVCRPYMKQRMDWVRFIPNKITDKLNSQARRIIGFDTRLASNLDEFFRPDDERLYKSNQE
jgi:ectoine hydroxylase-related dioxygenase (phytanoyl-CoA dioxygenase family)